MPLLDQIDKNPKDNHIDIQELQDAIKPEGFLTKEENIKGVSVELNTSEKEPIAKTLEDNLTKEINNILTKNTLTDADIKIIDLWVKLFGSNTEYTNTKQDLSKKLDTLVTDIAHNVGKIIAANTAPNKENYTATDIKQIQLRANLHFGANVAIDGKRGSSINLSQNTPNAQLTNLYIYRLELTYRKDIVDTRKSLKYSQIFEHMLQTPNLEAALNSLPDQQSQNKVFLQFLDFYLKEIKQAGMFFEDKIGGSVLSVLFIYMVNAEKYKDDQVQSKFYIDQITKTKKEIKDFNQNNIDANDSVAINDRLKALDKLGVNDKPQKIKLYQELLDLCTKTNNQDLKGNLLIRISTTFTEAEIKQNFGTTVVADLSKTRDKISEDLKKYEKTNDILSQIENKKIGKRSLSAASRKEYAATRPGDANANQKGGLIGTFGDRPYGSRGNWKEQGFKTYTDFENSHVPSSVYKLQMPGAEPVIVRMPDVFESESIQSLIKLSNNLDANTYLVSPDYTKEFSAKGWGNGGDGYNYKTMDHAEKDKNILDFDDFAIAKKQKNGDITLHKIKGATSYEVKPYETITLDQQHKASQTSNLALRSTYTPEAVQSFTDLGDIQTTMGNIQTLYDKMGTAKIDWKNTNVFGAIFAMTNPMAAPLLNTYIPVEGGLSSKDEKAIYTQATEMKLKIIDLRKQENKLISLRDQIQKMEKNIDKSKIITPEERKIMQALDAINFLIQNIKPGGSFEEFINYMTNPKYVGTNGTFTALGMEWIKNNGLKFICAIGMAVAVIAAIPSGGASLLTIAAIGTVGGMAGSRLGQRANEGLQNTVFTKEVIIDGKVHTMVYNDPTDIKLLSEGKLSPQDFAMSVGREFAVGTVSMFGFMKAGQIIGNSISKFMLANESSPITTMLRKVPKLNKMNDPYTTNIFETIAKKGGEKGFFNKFSAEFGEEIVQEGGEGVANTISEKSGIPGLAMLVTTWNSLTPGVNTKIYENNNVSVASIDRVGDNAVLDLHYAGNINELIQHFEKNGFILNADGTLSKPNAVAEKITDVIKLTPSMASIDVRNMDALFGTYGMQIDHTEANKVNFPSDIDPIKLKEFQDKFEHSGMGTVVINPDGSFDIRTMDKTIQFAPILSNALSPAIDIQLMQNMKTKVDAHYTNKKTILEGKINTETNEKIKKELQEDLDTLEKAYEKFNKILDGTITIDSYVGIRNIAKPLGLDIETEQLPLLKKMVENTIKTKNGGKEVTQKDIDAFINGELTIDKTIENVFGAVYAKPETFRGGDALTQITDILNKWPHESSELLSAGDIQTLQTFATGHIQALKDGMQLSEAQIFDLTQTNIRKLIFQNIADKGLLSGSDHGILHIVQGDVFAARSILDQTTGLDAKTKASIKAMVGQMIVDHDIGYNMQSFESMITKKPGSEDYDKSTFFDATKDHPIFSRLFVEANAEYYIKMFGQANFDAMKVAMLDHSDIHSTNFGASINQINAGNTKGLSTLLQQLIAAPDCMGVTHIDKLHKLFQHPNMLLLLGKFEFINLNFAANDPIGIKLNQETKAQMIGEINKMENDRIIDAKTAEYYRNAVDKGMDTENSGVKNPNGFGLKFNFSSYIYSSEGFVINPDNNGGKINMKLDLSMFQTVTGLYGDGVALNNLSKIIGDYGKVVDINGEAVASDVDYKQFAKDNFGLADKVQQANLGDVLSIQVQQVGGSIVTFEILITEIDGESAILERRLDNIATYNRDVNKSIQNILSELQKRSIDKKSIDKDVVDQNIAAIMTIDVDLGKAIEQIVNGKDVSTQTEQIQKLWSEHISEGYDKAIETNEKAQIDKTILDTDMGIAHISKEIEANKNNPKKLKEIIKNLTIRSKNAIHNLNEGLKNNVPGYKKTAHFLHAVSELTIIHHATHQLSGGGKDILLMGNGLLKGEFYTFTGAAIDLLSHIAGFAVTVIHAKHLLHGHMSSGLNVNNSLGTILNMIDQVGTNNKEYFMLKQEQSTSYNEINLLKDQWTGDNTGALLNNYMSHIKILCKGKLLESYPGFQKNFAALYPGVNILHIDDGFNHILTQIDQQQGDISDHIANIHTLLSYVQGNNTISTEILNYASDIYKRTVSSISSPSDNHGHNETINSRDDTFTP